MSDDKLGSDRDSSNVRRSKDTWLHGQGKSSDARRTSTLGGRTVVGIRARVYTSPRTVIVPVGRRFVRVGSTIRIGALWKHFVLN